MQASQSSRASISCTLSRPLILSALLSGDKEEKGEASKLGAKSSSDPFLSFGLEMGQTSPSGRSEQRCPT
jgi:hypothetical protein